MPRIVNGQVVNDEVPKRKTDEKRVFTWNDISSNNLPSKKADTNTLRSRASEQTAKQGPAPVVEQPAVPSIVGYIGNALGISEYKLRIPQDNPKVVIDGAYFVLFLFFTLVLGYKMAVGSHFFIQLGSWFSQSRSTLSSPSRIDCVHDKVCTLTPLFSFRANTL